MTVSETDVEYLRHGELSLLARLYRPDGPGPFPAIVDVHGGAWTMSDRLGNAPIDRHLAETASASSRSTFACRRLPSTRR